MATKTMVTVAMAMFAAAGCGVPQPSNEEVDAPAGAAGAIAVAMSEWADRVPGGADLRVEDLPVVRWFGPAPDGSMCLDYPDSAGAADCAKGGYSEAPFAEPEIHLLLLPIPESKIAHELLHASLDVTSGAPDHDHEGAIWSSVESVQVLLSQAGL